MDCTRLQKKALRRAKKGDTVKDFHHYLKEAIEEEKREEAKREVNRVLSLFGGKNEWI